MRNIAVFSILVFAGCGGATSGTEATHGQAAFAVATPYPDGPRLTPEFDLAPEEVQYLLNSSPQVAFDGTYYLAEFGRTATRIDLQGRALDQGPKAIVLGPGSRRSVAADRSGWVVASEAPLTLQRVFDDGTVGPVVPVTGAQLGVTSLAYQRDQFVLVRADESKDGVAGAVRLARFSPDLTLIDDTVLAPAEPDSTGPVSRSPFIGCSSGVCFASWFGTSQAHAVIDTRGATVSVTPVTMPFPVKWTIGAPHQILAVRDKSFVRISPDGRIDSRRTLPAEIVGQGRAFPPVFDGTRWVYAWLADGMTVAVHVRLDGSVVESTPMTVGSERYGPVAGGNRTVLIAPNPGVLGVMTLRVLDAAFQQQGPGTPHLFPTLGRQDLSTVTWGGGRFAIARDALGRLPFTVRTFSRGGMPLDEAHGSEFGGGTWVDDHYVAEHSVAAGTGRATWPAAADGTRLGPDVEVSATTRTTCSDGTTAWEVSFDGSRLVYQPLDRDTAPAAPPRVLAGPESGWSPTQAANAVTCTCLATGCLAEFHERATDQSFCRAFGPEGPRGSVLDIQPVSPRPSAEVDAFFVKWWSGALRVNDHGEIVGRGPAFLGFKPLLFDGTAHLQISQFTTSWLPAGSWTASPRVPLPDRYLGGLQIATDGDGRTLLAYRRPTPAGIGTLVVDRLKARLFRRAPEGPGARCWSADDCALGHCVDGVCCDSECGGGLDDCVTCRRAEGASADGFCTALTGPVCGAEGERGVCSDGACVGLAPLPCPPRLCSTGGVLVTHDQCEWAAEPAGTSCDDEDPCTEHDSCLVLACAGIPKKCAPVDACHVAGQCDEETGACSRPLAPDGTTCDDGNPCTTGDSCAAGSCEGAAIACASPGSCTIARCNPASGGCETFAANEGVACDDANACTREDACAAGTCRGTPIECPGEGECADGACDPVTGECQAMARPDGLRCDDDDPCTQNDHCASGGCRGAPRACPAPDACHEAGTCDPASGACTFNDAAEGTVCDDGDPCTSADACAAGRCIGSPITCARPDACHEAGVCRSDTGLCDYEPAPDGRGCNDGNACTRNDACLGGQCLGVEVTCATTRICQHARCRPETGACTEEAEDDGAACPAGVCSGGECLDLPRPRGPQPREGPESAYEPQGCDCATGPDAPIGILFVLVRIARGRRTGS